MGWTFSAAYQTDLDRYGMQQNCYASCPVRSWVLMKLVGLLVSVDVVDTRKTERKVTIAIPPYCFK